MKIIYKVIIFIFLLVTLDFAIGRTLRYLYFKETWGLNYRTTYALESADAEILVFGSSRANHHYVPEVMEDSLKMSYYNTGRENNGILFQTALLKSILTRYTPKIILLDLSGGFDKTDNYDYLSSLLPYYKEHQEIREIVELRSPFEKIKLASEIYPFNSQILRILVENINIFKNKFPDSNKGYIALNREWKINIEYYDTFTYQEVDSIKINYLRKFISLAKETGANVFVFYSPIFVKFNNNQEIDICNDICSSENVPFYNFSKDTLFTNNGQLFHDYLHLNHKGAIKFSNLVVEKIKYGTSN